MASVGSCSVSGLDEALWTEWTINLVPYITERVGAAKVVQYCVIVHAERCMVLMGSEDRQAWRGLKNSEILRCLLVGYGVCLIRGGGWDCGCWVNLNNSLENSGYCRACQERSGIPVDGIVYWSLWGWQCFVLGIWLGVKKVWEA
jgi:hypothetical protein